MSAAVLVVGLGNPGPEYERTRHNIGQMAVDVLCERLGARLKPLKGVRALSAEARDGEARIILARPTTYMNESGEAVAPLARYYKVAPAQVVVIHDELDLPLGAIRVKQGGGDAGHNGLKSVSRSLKTREYVRVRAGIGRPPGRQKGADYVLRPFGSREADEAAITVQKAADAVMSIVHDGVDVAQDKHNDKPPRAPKPPARMIRASVEVPASPEEVFDAFTTVEGVRSFFAPAARIELRRGGAYEPLFDLDAPEGERGAEGCTVLTYRRPGLLVFSWNAPPSIPTVRAARKTRVEVLIEESPRARSAVTLTHTGWGKGEDWDQAFDYFSDAWPTVLGRLVERFTSGPRDWTGHS